MQSVLLTSNARTPHRLKSAPGCIFARHRKLQDKVYQKQRRFSNSSLLMRCHTDQFIQCRAGKTVFGHAKGDHQSNHQQYLAQIALCYKFFLETRQNNKEQHTDMNAPKTKELSNDSSFKIIIRSQLSLFLFVSKIK